MHPPNSCFINNYYPIMLKAWGTNIDLKPVFNSYEAIFYVPAYCSKSRSEASRAILRACS